MTMWEASGFVERLGAGHLFASKREAIAAIVPKLDPAICAGCRARIFEECSKQPGAPVVPAAAADP
jgi:SulP family sulfate permease